MCGIVGFIDRRCRDDARSLEAAVLAMARTMRHRGPDDEGTWVDAQAGIALGHRRLSIIDLSPAGHQPMVSADGRYVMVYNGEVYNFRELRRELEAAGHTFRGASDSEVVLEGCARWGVERAVERLIGMFAFAIWDRSERILFLVRDRLGIKPLYWGAFDDIFLFASELKALRAFKRWPVEIDLRALSGFLRHNYVASPASIYRGVAKLAPGHLVRLRHGRPPEIVRYWDLGAIAGEGRAARWNRSDRENTEELETLLKDAVRRRMVADVPLGVFLSGGIDSSTVAALMQSQSDRPVRSFSIGFSEDRFNEAEYAKVVARHLGTDHTDLYVEPADALAVIPELADWYDEPFADSSQIPTLLLSRLTREHVTVALSGDGGDELFAGYSRYFWADTMWRTVRHLPYPLRRGAAEMLRAVPSSAWARMLQMAPRRIRPARASYKAFRLPDFVAARDADDLYRRLITFWDPPPLADSAVRKSSSPVVEPAAGAEIPDFIARMQVYDSTKYLPDDILTKVDRASMAASLEVRVPLLDHRVVELAWRMPPSMKYRNGVSKWILRRILERYVPAELIDRPKAGFAIPIQSWLRGPLRDWAEALLDERRLREDGIFDAGAVRRRWSEYVDAARPWHESLWGVLMFQAWKERWLDGR